jgi:hypothetical protein
MAKVKLSSALIRARGKMGNVVFRKYHDEVIMAQVPDMSGVTPTAKQAAHRGRFKLGVLYGRTVLADPVKKAIYEATAKAKGIPVFALTVADFMRAPVVDQVDLSAYTGKAGETIRITASDDFEVAGVGVAIHDTAGAVLEQGAATLADGVWNYVTTANLPPGQQVSIEVTATDRPGPKTTKTQTPGWPEGREFAAKGRRT